MCECGMSILVLPHLRFGFPVGKWRSSQETGSITMIRHWRRHYKTFGKLTILTRVQPRVRANQLRPRNLFSSSEHNFNTRLTKKYWTYSKLISTGKTRLQLQGLSTGTCTVFELLNGLSWRWYEHMEGCYWLWYRLKFLAGHYIGVSVTDMSCVFILVCFIIPFILYPVLPKFLWGYLIYIWEVIQTHWAAVMTMGELATMYKASTET